MAQQWIKDWIVRTVGPQQETEYYLVGSSDPKDAKVKIECLLRAQGKSNWHIDDAVEPRRI